MKYVAGASTSQVTQTTENMSAEGSLLRFTRVKVGLFLQVFQRFIKVIGVVSFRVRAGELGIPILASTMNLSMNLTKSLSWIHMRKPAGTDSPSYFLEGPMPPEATYRLKLGVNEP